MSRTLMDFFVDRNVEATVSLSGRQDSTVCPRFELRLKKGAYEQHFDVLGNPESDGPMTAEDAIRALLTRVRMYEGGVSLSTHQDAINKETALGLRELLGTTAYGDLQNLDDNQPADKAATSLFFLKPELQTNR